MSDFIQPGPAPGPGYSDSDPPGEDDPAPGPDSVPPLIGETATERLAPPLGRIVLLAFFPVPLILALLVRQPWWMALSVPLLCSGVMLWVLARRPQRFEFHPAGIQLNRAPGFVAYEDVRAIYSTGGIAGQTSLHLCLEDGEVAIPHTVDLSIEQIEAFLGSVCPVERLPPTVPRELQGFHDNQARIFGPETVFVFRPRPSLSSGVGVPPAAAFFLGLALSGVVWAFLSPWLGSGWLYGGLTLALLSLLIAVLCFLVVRRQSHPVSDRDRACLILSPGGMALIQDALKGELRWSEVLDIKLVSSKIEVRVEGARIHIADVYQEAASRIHDRMRSFWSAIDIRRR